MNLRGLSWKRWIGGLCGAALLALGFGTLAPQRLAAQAGTRTIVLRSPLHSIFEGHILQLTVAELGTPSVPSVVSIEFRDASNQRRAITTTTTPNTITPSTPVRLQLPMAAGSGLNQMRALVRITTFGGGSAPAVSFEDVDVNSFTVRSFPPCTLATGGTSSDTPGSGWEAMCIGGGWSTTTTFLP